MTEDADPLLTFFSAEEAEDCEILYTVLGLARGSTPEQIRKAYRKHALRCHPDKHAHKAEHERATVTVEFQKIGFAFAVLSDDKRRKLYDATGRTNELVFADAEDGWEAYFNDLFERVDRKVLDDDKKKYQGSDEELEDILSAYLEHKGNFERIIASIPHSTVKDEERIVAIVEREISAGRLERTKKWSSTSADKGARKKRKRAAEKESAQAEAEAKRLGVWDEFYGSGAKGRRQADGAATNDDGEASLAALIRSRNQSRASGFAALEAKYTVIEDKYATKKKKGKKAAAAEPHPDELDDAAFEALQAKMFGGSGKKKQTKAAPHHDDLDDEAFAALQAKMFANKSKGRK